MRLAKDSSIHSKKIATFAAALGTAWLTPELVSAEVICFSPSDPIIIGDDNPSEAFDIDGDGTNDFVVSVSAYGFNLFGSTNLIHTDASEIIQMTPPGGVIGTDTTDWSSNGEFTSFIGLSGFAGLEFEIAPGSSHFGYLDVEVGEVSLTIHGGKYESVSDTPIRAVPEPGSIAALAFGAMACTLRRRRNGSTAN